MRLQVDTVLFATFFICVSESGASTIQQRSFLAGNYDPSPPASEAPPFSENAIRDPSYLPAQVGILLGSWVLVTVVVGTTIFIVRSRLKKQAARTRNDIELLENRKDFNSQVYVTPLSPRNFYHPGLDPKGPNPYVFPATQTWEQTSPISPVGNDPNVDPRIAEQDRARLDQGLEDLYAHVMEQEEAKLAGIDINELPKPQPAPSAHWSPQVPQTPTSQRNTITKSKRPSNIEMGERSSRTSSLISSIMSPGRKKKERGMVISNPIPTPLRSTFPSDYPSDEEPLSPAYNKAPPPIPTDQEPYRPSHSRDGSALSNSTDPSPISPVTSIAEHLQPYNRSQVNFAPTPNERSTVGASGGHQYNRSQTSISTTRSTERRGTPLLSNPSGIPTSPRAGLSNGNGGGLPASPRASPAPLKLASTPRVTIQESKPDPSVGSTQRSLPFRAFDPPPGLGVPSLNNPLQSPQYQPQTKTTVLERAAHPALLSPGLKTPWTAGAVPYSPYQPFSPLMPVTPTLVTREDRKREKKEAKGRGRRKEIELVEAEEDTWGAGY